VLPRREAHAFYRELFQQSYLPFFEDSLGPSARLRQMAGRALR
jgi:hypothetical protein